MSNMIPALASGTRVPLPFVDEDGTACLRVPLDDAGTRFAIVERSDYLHVVLTLGCRAAWCWGGAQGRRKYVRVNAPHVGGQASGSFPVVRLFLGVGPEHRVRYATSNTLDLRRCNLIIGVMQDGRNLAGGTLMASVISRREAMLSREAAERRQSQDQRTQHYTWGG